VCDVRNFEGNRVVVGVQLVTDVCNTIVKEGIMPAE